MLSKSLPFTLRWCFDLGYIWIKTSTKDSFHKCNIIWKTNGNFKTGHSSGPEVVKLSLCSTQLSIKFFLLINLRLLTIANSFLLNIAEKENFSANKHENASWVEQEKSFITFGFRQKGTNCICTLFWKFSALFSPHFLNKLRCQKTHLWTDVPSQHPDQPAHSCSLFRIFTEWILDSQGCKVSSCRQQRPQLQVRGVFIFLISRQKHMLWVLIKSALLRYF